MLGATMVLSGCNRDKDDDKPDTQSVDDNNLVQKEYDDLLNIVEDVSGDNSSDMDKSGTPSYGAWFDDSCATVTLDTGYSDASGAIGKITVDFGTENCTGPDGRSRRGKIIVTYTGRYRTVGSVITTTLENYHVNDHKIEGTKVVTHSEQYKYQVSVSGAKITWTDGTTTTWNSERTREWTEGTGTIFDLSDDVHVVNGTANGTNRLGTNFDAEITDLTVKIQCWLSKVFIPASGTITVTPEGATPRIVDYGDGTCDKTVTLTVGNKTYEHTFE